MNFKKAQAGSIMITLVALIVIFVCLGTFVAVSYVLKESTNIYTGTKIQNEQVRFNQGYFILNNALNCKINLYNHEMLLNDALVFWNENNMDNLINSIENFKCNYNFIAFNEELMQGFFCNSGRCTKMSNENFFCDEGGCNLKIEGNFLEFQLSPFKIKLYVDKNEK
ncbi:MAG: hypothetical protein ACOYT4_04375 [Nanoarchaeota archaeon]